jgi:hypothetical protein
MIDLIDNLSSARQLYSFHLVMHCKQQLLEQSNIIQSIENKLAILIIKSLYMQKEFYDPHILSSNKRYGVLFLDKSFITVVKVLIYVSIFPYPPLFLCIIFMYTYVATRIFNHDPSVKAER